MPVRIALAMALLWLGEAGLLHPTAHSSDGKKSKGHHVQHISHKKYPERSNISKLVSSHSLPPSPPPSPPPPSPPPSPPPPTASPKRRQSYKGPSEPLSGLPPISWASTFPTGRSISSCAIDPIFQTCRPTHATLLGKGTHADDIPFGGR